MIKFYLLVKRLLPVVFLASTMTVALAQERAVTGRVTSADDGSSVPGVNIVEKGTSNGAVSDADGNFKINVGPNATLVFSFVGYATKEIEVGAQNKVDVSLESDVKTLQEVVVTGYGSQEKKEITGAVVSMKTENFNRGNIQDPSQLLQGKVAGVSITKTGSDPNEPFTVRLRGLTTLGANQSPLYVIDGVIGASIANVDPNDIASMDVLKDGSAAAIYGTQGSSGVILITTKKGKQGKTVVDFNSYVANDQIAKSVPVMDRTGYLAVGGTDVSPTPGGSTDWLKEVTRSAVTVVNNLGLSGGQGNTTYRFALNVRDVQGILKNSGFDQINGRFSLQQSAFQNKVRFALDASATTRNTNYSFNEAMRYALLYNPTAPVMESDPSKNPTGTTNPYYERSLFDNFNPVAIINQNTNDGKKTTINVNGKLDIDIMPGLTGTMTYAIQRENELLGQYYSRYAYFRGFNRQGLASRSTNVGSKDILEMYLSYNKQFNDLNLAVTGGYSYQQKQVEGYQATTGKFLSDVLGYNALQNSQDLQTGNGLPGVSSYGSPNQKLIGFFGRANLNYKETYLLSASYRHEGSTGFGLGKKWGDFGSVSGAVVLNKLFDIPSVSNLKLRVGYGLTGALPGTYGLSQTQYSQSTSYGYSAGSLTPVVNTTLAPNPNLSWEKKSEINAGIDFGFMNNRLTGSFDVYQRNAKDFILERPIDASTNVADRQWQNTGEIKSTGVELAVTYAAIQKADFTWSTTLVASHVKSVLVSLPGTEASATGLPENGSSLGAPGQNSTYTINNIAGEQVGTFFGNTFLGIDKATGNQILSPTAGIIGHALPTLDLGFTNSFTYKNWDLNIFLRGTFGHQIINSWRAFYEPVVGGQISSYNRVQTKYFDPNLKNPQFSSYYIEKGDFVKLDNATIGYNFKFAQGSMISKLRVYAGGNNLFVITGYTGTDPEARLVDAGQADNGGFVSGAGNPLAAGIDRRNTYFRARTVTLGVNLSF